MKCLKLLPSAAGLAACGIAPEGRPLSPDLLKGAQELPDTEGSAWIRLGSALALDCGGQFDDTCSRCEYALPAAVQLNWKLALRFLQAIWLCQLGRSAEARKLLRSVQTFRSRVQAANPNAALPNTDVTRGNDVLMRLISRALHERPAEWLQPEEADGKKLDAKDSAAVVAITRKVMATT